MERVAIPFALSSSTVFTDFKIVLLFVGIHHFLSGFNELKELLSGACFITKGDDPSFLAHDVIKVMHFLSEVFGIHSFYNAYEFVTADPTRFTLRKDIADNLGDPFDEFVSGGVSEIVIYCFQPVGIAKYNRNAHGSSSSRLCLSRTRVYAK